MASANPAYDDVDLERRPRRPRRSPAKASSGRAYQEADETLTLARSLVGKDPTTFVASDHGFAPQFLAIDASKPLVDLRLLSAPQTSNCRPVATEPRRQAMACWAGGALQIYLNIAGRDPDTRPPEARNEKLANGSANPLFKPDLRMPAQDAATWIAKIKAAYLGLTDPNDWTHDGKPENWKMIDRVFTKAEARYIPIGDGQTADMAHPTRTGDLVVIFAVPPYQFDAETPGKLVAPSHFFGQHGYLPSMSRTCPRT